MQFRHFSRTFSGTRKAFLPIPRAFINISENFPAQKRLRTVEGSFDYFVDSFLPKVRIFSMRLFKIKEKFPKKPSESSFGQVESSFGNRAQIFLTRDQNFTNFRKKKLFFLMFFCLYRMQPRLVLQEEFWRNSDFFFPGVENVEKSLPDIFLLRSFFWTTDCSFDYSGDK